MLIVEYQRVNLLNHLKEVDLMNFSLKWVGNKVNELQREV